MSQLRDQLVDEYAEHFARVNESLDVKRMSAKDFGYHDRTFGAILKTAPRPAKILDLGCGVGFLLNWLCKQPGVTPVGVDASSTQVELARRAFPQIEITLSDGLEYLRSNPDSFDGIFCTDVLEHIPGTDLCIEWVRAVRPLRPGGFFICRTPNAANLTASYSRYIDLTHERSFTDISILQLLHSGGLTDTRILPIVGGSVGSRARQFVERTLHRIVYRICGQGTACEFSSNVCAMGRRSATVF